MEIDFYPNIPFSLDHNFSGRFVVVEIRRLGFENSGQKFLQFLGRLRTGKNEKTKMYSMKVTDSIGNKTTAL